MKFGWKGIILVIAVYGVIDEVFHADGLATAAAIAVLAVLLILPSVEKKGSSRADSRTVDYTRNGGLKDSAKVDQLYREYASVIDGFHITPLHMFSDVLHRDQSRVLVDLNILISAGRFQRAHVEYDDETLVIDEYSKERKPEDMKPKSTDEPVNDFSSKKNDITSAIESASAYVWDENMRSTLTGIETSAGEILNKLDQEPDLASDEVKRFTSFYLPKTVECVDNYSKLLQKSSLTEQEESAKYDLESALRAINSSFRKLRQSLTSSDAVDMAAEAQAVKMMLENDGLTDDFPMMRPKEKADDRADS